MDEFLNELYGTSEPISGDDLEKNAAAEFLVKLAEQEGVNLDDLSDEEVGGLLAEIEGDMGKQASAGEGEGEGEGKGEGEAQEKFAEADFLGRAMAHAYVAELAEIEKEAQMIGPQIGAARLGYRRLKELVGRGAKAAGEWTGAAPVKRGLKARGELAASAREGAKKRGLEGKAAKEHVKSVLRSAKQAPSQQEMRAGAKRLAKRVGAPAAGLAALETGRRVATGGKEARSFDESFEAAATERAYEMLAEAGYDVEKVARADIDTAALQMLEQAGYDVNWG
jgi:hypothetical protein